MAALTRVQQVRLVALIVSVAMAVHMLLRATAARSFEPLTFLVPGIVLLVSVTIYLLAARMPPISEQSR